MKDSTHVLVIQSSSQCSYCTKLYPILEELSDRLTSLNHALVFCNEPKNNFSDPLLKFYQSVPTYPLISFMTTDKWNELIAGSTDLTDIKFINAEVVDGTITYIPGNSGHIMYDVDSILSYFSLEEANIDDFMILINQMTDEIDQSLHTPQLLEVCSNTLAKVLTYFSEPNNGLPKELNTLLSKISDLLYIVLKYKGLKPAVREHIQSFRSNVPTLGYSCSVYSVLSDFDAISLARILNGEELDYTLDIINDFVSLVKSILKGKKEYPYLIDFVRDTSIKIYGQ